MNNSEFKNVYERMCNYYNKENYKDDFGIRDIYYQAMKYITPEKWNVIEKQLFSKFKFMPKVAEIVELNNATKEEKEIKARIECPICDGCGYITVFRKNDGVLYEFAYVCDCGNEEKYDGSKLKDTKHRTPFYTPSITELPEYELIKTETNKLGKTDISTDKIKEIINELVKKMRGGY